MRRGLVGLIALYDRQARPVQALWLWLIIIAIIVVSGTLGYAIPAFIARTL